MNDGLQEAIAQAFIDDPTKSWDIHPMSAASIAAYAVRAWLLLPPSEEEIEAATTSMFKRWHQNEWLSRIVPPEIGECRDFVEEILAASRAVLVRPPEETK